MKIGIAGYGHVGRAYAAVLQNYHETEIIDPKHYDKKISSDVDAVVICVSTPKGLAGACNMLHVTDVLEDCPDVPILIKSTISVQGWSYINDKFDKKIAYCPEFLRADKALDDIRQQEHIMIGGKEVSFWIKLFKEIFPSCPHIITANPEELIAVKYFRNAFLATKVSFFNQVYDFCKASGIDFDNVRKGVALDKRINASHTLVTKDRGFGGPCFPKDVEAIRCSALYYEVDLSIIAEIIKYNKDIKNDIDEK